VPIALCALLRFFLARLPALVELIPPADTPLIKLRFVLCVAAELVVTVLRFPEDALVEFVVVVKVLPII
jgi:hypothetical protein